MFCYCCTLAPSCNHSHLSESLQEGDLLFQDLNCGDLCNAIEVFTEGVNGKYFSVQWWVKINDTLKVVEAIGDKVQVNSLNNFFERSGDTSTIKNVTIARVKHNYKPLITKATAFAKQQIGQPYDNDFLLENGKWYSSELLYQSFKESNNQNDFFRLEPMTFKYPKTKTFFPAWVDHFKQQNSEIPEGKQGVNPGLISRSNKIQVLKIEHIK